ncbi:hypothetical protein CEB3_c25500 [Peptococcaceae bacterium CEB3]|nr:hypothetical protein CEB3_c25500 [Peptococcaceae bacterium CEB3]
MVSLILLVLIIFLVLLSAKAAIFRVKLTSWKTGAVLAGVYLVILLLSVLFLPLLPSGKLAEPAVHSAQLTSSPDPKVLFRLAAEESPGLGTKAYPAGIYQNSGQEFTLEGATLHLKIPNNGNYIVLVEKSDKLAGKIKAATFVSTYESAGIDFTARIAPPFISLQNNTLTVEPGLPQRFTFKVAENSPFGSQFKGGKTGRAMEELGYSNFSSTMGWQAICLVVPKDLKIDKGNSFVIVQ